MSESIWKTNAASLIAVCGPGQTKDSELLKLAEAVGRELARAGLGMVCGGRGGVMEAACRGARAAGGLTVGILPSYEAKDANPYVDITICTGLGEARNAVIAATGRAMIAVGGEWGTLSEIALALKIGRPVITLAGFGWNIGRAGQDQPPTGRISIARSPIEAVEIVSGLIKSA